jgi:hypothetical protein
MRRYQWLTSWRRYNCPRLILESKADLFNHRFLQAHHNSSPFLIAKQRSITISPKEFLIRTSLKAKVTLISLKFLNRLTIKNSMLGKYITAEFLWSIGNTAS